MVGVNSRLAGPEVAYVLNDASAELVFVGKDFVPLIEADFADCPTVRRVIAMDGGHNDWESFDIWRAAHEATPPNLDYQPDDDFIQLYTSGTTGHPKGVQLTNTNMGSALHQANRNGAIGRLMTMFCCACRYFTLPVSMLGLSVWSMAAKSPCCRSESGRDFAIG